MAFGSDNVRLWHKADMLNALTNVGFWGQSGHAADTDAMLLMTHSGNGNLLSSEIAFSSFSNAE